MIWLKPQFGVRYLLEKPNLQWLIVIGLPVLYLAQICVALLWAKDGIGSYLERGGLKSAILFLIFGPVTVYVCAEALSLGIWSTAKHFYGEGTRAQTRAAILWAMVWSGFLGFFLILNCFAYTHEDLLGMGTFILGLISTLGALATLVYMIVTLVITVAETSKLSMGKASLSVFAGLFTLGVMVYAAFFYS